MRLLSALWALTVFFGTLPLLAQTPALEQCSPAPVPTIGNGTLIETLVITETWSIDDTQVQIDMTHPFLGNLIVEVSSPSATTVRLHDQGGFNGDDLLLTYTDQGVQNGTLPFTCDCEMQPSGPGAMGNFTGESTLGDWDLSVQDLFSNVGTLNEWCLVVFSDDATFRRGDIDGDGMVLLNDAVFLLRFLFIPGSNIPVCPDAADIDDSGNLNLADAQGLLSYLFVPSSTSPAPPGPNICGTDRTADGLSDCLFSSPCP